MSSPFELLLESLLVSALDVESRSQAMRQLANRFRGCRKSGLIWHDEGSRAPTMSGDPRVIPPVEVPGSSDELVAVSVMMATYKSGILEPRGG